MYSRELSELDALSQMRCTHRGKDAHERRARGRIEGTRQYESAKAAAYPQGMNAHLIAVIDRAKPAHHETAEGRNSVGDAESEMQTATDTPEDRWETDKGDDEWDENEWEEHGEGQEGQQWETEEAIENEMKWGDGNVEDTEETTRQHDAQGDGCDVDAETSAKNDEGGTPTCEACERQVGDDDSREQGDSDSDTSEDEVHKTQTD